jgi:cyclophilin family peptidyl-prolyl cis-trans isomerase
MGRWIGLVALVVAGCGVDQAEHDRVLAERDLLDAKVGDLEDRLSEIEQKNVALGSELSALRMAAETEREQHDVIKEVRSALGISDGKKLMATFKTSLGDIDCDLWTNVAPKTVRNFVELAEGKKSWTDPRTGSETTTPLYDNTKFHRVIPSFMIQGGDPLGTGTGGPGYRFEDEVDPSVRFEQPGLLAMANSGPGTNRS